MPKLSPTSILAAACVALLLACDTRVAPIREWRPEDHGQPAMPDDARTPSEPQPEQGGTERAAEALFIVSCAGCHGRDGRGLGSQRPPGAQLPDFTSKEFQASQTDAQLLDAIRNGRSLMPAFGKKVNAEGLRALVKYVRTFGTQ